MLHTYFEHFSHRIYKLHAIVLGWVVAGCDHDPNYGVFLLGAASGSQANTEDNMIQTRIPIRRMTISDLFLHSEDFTVSGNVWHRAVSGGWPYAFMRN